MTPKEALFQTVSRLKYENNFRFTFVKIQLSLDNRIFDLWGRVAGPWPDDKRTRMKIRKALLKADNGKPLDLPEGFEISDEDFATGMGLCAFLYDCRKSAVASRKKHEKRMVELAESLPVWPWVENVRGIGALMLGQIVGEAGDLSGYANPAKLWKRFGVGTIGGVAQRRAKGPDGIEMGFSPRRRAVMWNAGECLVKLNDDGFRSMYDKRKEFELERGFIKGVGSGTWNEDENRWEYGSYERSEMSKGHAHRRAKRYMEKRFLRELWKQWRNPTDPIQL